MKLVVVESPGKVEVMRSLARRLLGGSVYVFATRGHVFDFDRTSTLPVPGLVVIDLRRKIYERLGELIKRAERVYLAFDADREGELMSHFVLEAFPGVAEKAFRVRLRALVEEEVARAFLESDGALDGNLLLAAYLRKVLDWRLGRVLSMRVREQFPSVRSLGRVKVGVLDLAEELARTRDFRFTGTLHVAFGFGRRYGWPVKGKVEGFVGRGYGVVRQVAVSRGELAPPKGLSTGRALAGGVRRSYPGVLGARAVMGALQALYDRGFLSYIRTRATAYSETGEEFAARLVETLYPGEYHPGDTTRAEAHEAIRPVRIPRAAELDEFRGEEKEVFRDVLGRFVASRMRPARGEKCVAEVEFADGGRGVFTCFRPEAGREGFLKEVWRGYVPGEDLRFPRVGDVVYLEGRVETPAERLFRLMEDRLVGQPSTYVRTVEGLSDQGLISRDDTVEVTETGREVFEWVRNEYPFLSADFSSRLERVLDEVAGGRVRPEAAVELYRDEVLKRAKAGDREELDVPVSAAAEVKKRMKETAARVSFAPVF
ncbi:DNA topoisomerase [Thermosulfurimonas sp. F29]|uniref:DNA topoisomerase n=1 Tax=Thermosulfurimonas sp. F29 TaxID=2867247 RepID=UPI001C83BB94|nr:DNA topoisomerase [Thermosulfurimonas sp. F29]MBX6424207.1 hypothetical protein [Thermosulfurimonas sp. F29]